MHHCIGRPTLQCCQSVPRESNLHTKRAAASDIDPDAGDAFVNCSGLTAGQSGLIDNKAEVQRTTQQVQCMCLQDGCMTGLCMTAGHTVIVPQPGSVQC